MNARLEHCGTYVSIASMTRILALLVMTLSVMLAAPHALAAKGGKAFIVNSTANTTDESCDPAPGGCTLRDAVFAVNAGLGKTIRFDPDVFPPSNLTAIEQAWIRITSGSGVTIDGTGAGVVLNGQGLSETNAIFIRTPAGEALTGVTIRNLAIVHYEEGIFLCGGASCDAPVDGFTISSLLIGDITHTSGLKIVGSEIHNGQISNVKIVDTKLSAIHVEAEAEISKLTIENVEVVASENGILVTAHDITRVKIMSVEARQNEEFGVFVKSRTISGLVISDVLAHENNIGIGVLAVTISKFLFRDSVVTDSDSWGAFASADGPMTKVKIQGNRFENNGDTGFWLAGGSSRISRKLKLSDNTSNDNGGGGFHFTGQFSQVQLKGNRAFGNQDTGFQIYNCISKCKLDRNEASNNQAGGIYLLGDQSKISKNITNANTLIGIEVEGSDRVKITGNQAIGNGVGIQLFVVTNSRIQKNVARTSTGDEDLIDLTPDCGSNTWKKNEFGTRNQDCIE